MSAIENSKLAVIGAGAVGTSLAYAALIRRSAREIAIYDVNRARVEAEVLDLAHGTQFTGSSSVIGGDDLGVINGANVVVITAGAKQKHWQSRLDLAKGNVEILRDLMPRLVERAPDAVYVIVTNPCDVLTVAAREFGGLAASHVFSSGTVLDSSRLRWLLASKLGVATSSVHALIVGEHGDSEFPLWSQAGIGPVPLSQWALSGRGPLDERELEAIAEDVKTAAYRVIEGKGATNYAIGLAGARIVEAVLHDENAVLPVSSVLDGYRGVSAVALSVPSVVGSAGVSRVVEVAFSPKEQAQFERSAETVQGVLSSLGLATR
jgi:L-lactate dehydrogenase